MKVNIFMKTKIRYCHICGAEVHGGSHWHLHKDIDLTTLKVGFYIFNFPKLADKNKLQQMYEIEKQSLPMLCKYVGGIDLKAMAFMLSYYKIQIRTIKQALNLQETKNRFIQTCLDRYNATNTLSKGTPGYIKKKSNCTR